MIDADLPRFAGTLGLMAETFGRPVTDGMVRGWRAALADLPIEAVEAACLAAMRTCARMPAPVHVRQLCGEAAPADQAEIEALRSWEWVLSLVRGWAPGAPPPEMPAVTAETVRRMGGLRRLAAMPEAEVATWARREYVRLYVAAWQIHFAPAAPAALPAATQLGLPEHGGWR